VNGVWGIAPPGDTGSGEDRPPGITDPITDGEARVLCYLPTTLSARKIADELSALVNTSGRTRATSTPNSVPTAAMKPFTEPAPSGLLVPPSRA
jgi:hypothetical protein